MYVHRMCKECEFRVHSADMCRHYQRKPFSVWEIVMIVRASKWLHSTLWLTFQNCRFSSRKSKKFAAPTGCMAFDALGKGMERLYIIFNKKNFNVNNLTKQVPKSKLNGGIEANTWVSWRRVKKLNREGTRCVANIRLWLVVTSRD